MVRRHVPTGPIRVGTVRVLPLPFGIGLAAAGVCSVIAAVTGLAVDGSDARPEMLALGLVGAAGIASGIGVARLHTHARLTVAMGLSMLVVAWVGAAIVATLSLWITGEFETIADSGFEAVSAVTTTGFTTIEDPQELTHATRLMRVLLPWTAGLGVLVAAMGVLPVAISGAELMTNTPLQAGRQLVTTAQAAMRNIVILYLLLTGVLFAGYWIGGMTFFDAFSYSLSTASTGGMANHADSIGAVDSTLIDWIASAGMAAAGGNLIVVWWAFRGAWQPVFRSTELRLYVSLLVIGFFLVWYGDAETGPTESAFAVTSMLSTTGLRTSNWAGGAPIVEAVLLVAAGLGAMSGSVGSGVRLARVARVALEVRRGLRRLLHPNRIGVIRIDGVAVRERSLELTYGYLWMHLITLAGVAALLNTSQLDVVGTLSFTLSLVSNVGILVDGEITSLVRLSGWSEAVGAFAMLLGRLSIYPVLLTIIGFGRTLLRLRPKQAIGSEA